MRFLVALLLAFGVTGPTWAQGEGSSLPLQDAQFWFSTGTQLKPFRKKGARGEQPKFFREFTVTGELGWRFNENVSHLNQFNIDAGFRYPLTDFLRVGTEYRYSMRDRYTTNRHRMALQLSARHKFGRLKTNYRFTYQHSFREPEKVRTLLRNRIVLAYDIPKWKLDPFVRVESFTALHYTGNRLDAMRFDLGTDMNLNKKRNTLEVAVRHDRELNQKLPEYAWILVLSLDTSWKKK